MTAASGTVTLRLGERDPARVTRRKAVDARRWLLRLRVRARRFAARLVLLLGATEPVRERRRRVLRRCARDP